MHMRNLKKTTALLLSLLLLIPTWGCSNETPDKETDTDTPAVETDAPTPEDTIEPGTDDSNETEPETVPPLPDDAEIVDNPVTDPAPESAEETDAAETAMPESDTAESESVPAETEEVRVYNYLTGATVTEEEQAKRPVAIMMNNIKNCLPQDNITAGDFYYECAAEGGITRIMMLVSEYSSLGQVGSIRSSRDYFVDFLANHDALYIHAGGSEMAYDEIFAREIDNLDGVNMYIPDMFYRDTYRMNNIGLEHSLMTTGEKIVDGIAYKNYETEHDESFVSAFKFYDETEDVQPVGSLAYHVHMVSTPVQTVDFVYDDETREYLRYQYNGMAHVDGVTGEQISVKNVIILFTDISLIPGDTAGRLSVTTVGKGQGYYITNGRRRVITWERESDTAPIKLTYRSDGEEVILNCGKTFVCVVDNSVSSKIDFNYTWDK